ncbi:hypothetical protein HQ590_08180 [bacterium]|nr:hypothetical protein [bacterium]
MKLIPLGITAADPVFHTPATRALLARQYEVHDFSDWSRLDAAALLVRFRSVEVVLTGRTSPALPLALAGDFGRLRCVLHLFGTIRGLVDKRLIERGLTVSNWGDDVARVAEGALALLVCQLNQLTALNAHVQGGADARVYQSYPPTLDGRDVGLYGYGPIGRHLARMLEPFGARIAVYDPYAGDLPAGIRRCATLRELFATCQVISIHCGLNDQTRDSVTRDLLELLPQGGILVNTARGRIVDEQALADLIVAGRLLAGVDVIRDEPRWTESPLAGLAGAVLTGHRVCVGKGYPPGQEPEPRLPEFAVRNLEAYAAGRPLINVVTAAEYDLKT